MKKIKVILTQLVRTFLNYPPLNFTRNLKWGIPANTQVDFGYLAG
ncbi:hypothetical protein [Peribacillus loiseleuriae]